MRIMPRTNIPMAIPIHADVAKDGVPDAVSLAVDVCFGAVSTTCLGQRLFTNDVM